MLWPLFTLLRPEPEATVVPLASGPGLQGAGHLNTPPRGVYLQGGRGCQAQPCLCLRTHEQGPCHLQPPRELQPCKHSVSPGKTQGGTKGCSLTQNAERRSEDKLTHLGNDRVMSLKPRPPLSDSAQAGGALSGE